MTPVPGDAIIVPVAKNMRPTAGSATFSPAPQLRSTDRGSTMTSTTAADSNATKFQDLLRELFQFDCPELDFGIYRILNHKRDVVERFINEKLPAVVDAELGRGPLAEQAKAKDDLAQARRNLITLANSMGEAAFDEHGELTERYRTVPASGEYRDAQNRVADSGRSRHDVESAIYNRLFTFFRRYYEEGDFISQRRYSGDHPYAIPYNGEEVYLHWANRDQYYVKTDEHFRNYDWQAPNGVTVHFRFRNADVEQNNVKSTKRFFMPVASDAEWDADARAVTIPIEYRALNKDEADRHGNRDQQKKIDEAADKAIPQLLAPKAPDAASALTGERHSNGNGSVSHLLYHLRRYSARNNADFFIHKDLNGFLNQELDFYLKNEVLKLNNLAAAGQDAAEGWFQQLRLIKTVGGKIIDFLAQIENLQKMLWEKRKFVTETQYCLTLSNVGADFHADIIANEAQWNEWHDLFDVDGTDRSPEFLQDHPTLVVDTKHFCADFTNRLLASFDDLDGKTDGLLVHGDGWQAISLIEQGYRGRIQCIYIDPPYNTDASAILYKNDYKDSSWLSLMENRLSLSRTLMSETSVLCCAIDDEEVPLVRLVLRNLFPKELGIVPVRSNPAGRKSKGQFTPNHEYALFAGNSRAVPGTLLKTDKELARYPLSDSQGRFAWNNLMRHGSNDRRQDRPRLFYPIYVDEDDRIRVPNMAWNESREEYEVLEEPQTGETVVSPVRSQNGEHIEKNWHRGWQTVSKTPSEYRVRRCKTREKDVIDIDFKIRPDMNAMPKTWWDDSRYASANLGAKSLKDMFGESNFDFAKAVGLVEDCVSASHCERSSIVLDYFAGSGTTGHAVVNLNREDGGERKFILVEMREYFDTVLLPRIKKVTFTADWKDGKPQRQATPEEAERSPRIVKYIHLESYEDALDSISFEPKAGQLPLLESSDEYLLKYQLGWESRDSETLLNVGKLTDPFNYRLRVHVNGERRERTVDLPETFNYLIGLSVSTRHVYDDEGHRYLVYRGETRANPGRRVAVIWRATEGWTEEDFARDRDFVATQSINDNADNVYVNGDSCIPGAKPIEPMFKARMFADVSA